MSPSSRPPLTSRIRASFEGKRSKSEITSPTLANGFPTQDPESVRHAIDQAINSETFQNAIAANLARLIKPSIKTALDTIQPVVETVYAHEILLKQTNKSVENILLRLENGPEERKRRFSASDDGWEDGAPNDQAANRSAAQPNVDHIKELLEEHNARTAEQISTLSSSIKASVSSTDVTDGLAGLQADMGLVKQSVRSLELSLEQSHTTEAVIQAQLDQLKADLGLVIDAVGPDLGGHVKAINGRIAKQDPSLLAAHTTKLDMIATDVAALKGHSDTLAKINALSSELAALKAVVESGTVASHEHFGELSSQVRTVLSTVDEHGSTLTGIKEADARADILAALQKSNESHASHAAILGQIREKALSTGSHVAPVPVAASSNTESSEILTGLAADIVALKSTVEAGLTINNEHLSDLGAKIDNAFHVVEAHRAEGQNPAILAAVQKSNEYHASHAEALEGVKSISAASPVADFSNLDALHTQIGSIATTLHSHTSVLDDLKSHTTAAPTEGSPSENNHLQTMESDLKVIKDTLETHTSILNELKEDVSAEVLTALHNIIELQTNNSAVLAEIKESDVSDEILTALHSSNDSHANNAVVLKGIHDGVKASNDAHATHAASLDELKALRSAPSEAAPVPVAATSESEYTSALEFQLGTIASTLEGQNSTLFAIKNATDASNESHAAHTVALTDVKDATAASNTFHDSHAVRLSEIKEATAASNELHNSHASTLADIKDATLASNEFHNSHASTLADIKDATLASNEAHASHTTTLAELKSIQPVAASRGAVEDATNTGALETHMNTIITTLDTQSTMLYEIKAVTATNPEVLETVKESHTFLNTHTALLHSIKEETSHDGEILTTLTSLQSTVEGSKASIDSHGELLRELHASTDDLHSTTKDLHAATTGSHSSLSAAISTLALGGAAGAGAGLLTADHSASSSEILNEVQAVRAIVEKGSTSIDSVDENITSLKTQIDINHTTVTTAITTLNDELKAEMDASSTEIATSVTALSEDINRLDTHPLTTAVDGSSKEIRTLSSLVDSIGHNIDDLLDGVHLNERGVGQVKNQVVAGQGTLTPIPEGAWFKKSVPKLDDEGERSPPGAIVKRDGGLDEEDEGGDRESEGRVEPMSPIQEQEEEEGLEHGVHGGIVHEVAEQRKLHEEPIHETSVEEEPVHSDAIHGKSALQESAHEELTHDEPSDDKSIPQAPIIEDHIHDDPSHEQISAHERDPAIQEATLAAEEEAETEQLHTHTVPEDNETLEKEHDEEDHHPSSHGHGVVEEEEREEHVKKVDPAHQVEHDVEPEPAHTESELSHPPPQHEEPHAQPPSTPTTPSYPDPIHDPKDEEETPVPAEKSYPTVAAAPDAEPFSANPGEEGQDESESASASTSAITSPLSPTFSEGSSATPTGDSGGGKKGKKGKKDKGGGGGGGGSGKKGKKVKNELFVFDPDEGEGEGEGAA